jgi:hypothetical protein
MFINSKIIVSRLKNKTLEFQYFIIGSTLIFYIAFIFMFLYINIYVGLAVYWTLILIVILSYFFSKKLNIRFVDKNISIKIIDFLILVVIAITIFSVVFWDSATQVTPHFVDTFYNYKWIKDNLNIHGPIGYYPGLTIISSLPFTLIDPFYNLGIFSASLSMLVLLSINLILRYMLNFRSLVIFNIILHSMYFYPLLFSRNGLHNSLLFPVIFFGLIIFAVHNWKGNSVAKIFYFVALSVSAIATAPHILILTLPGIIIASAMTYGLSPRKNSNIFYFLLLSICTLYFGNKLGGRNELLDSAYTKINNSNLDILTVLIYEWGRIKFPIRNPLESVNSFFVYSVMLLALIFIILNKKRQFRYLYFTAIITFINGLILQTGIGEFSIIKGRIGWYFMYVTALFICLIYQECIKEKYMLSDILKNSYIILLILIANIFLVISNPPIAYRYPSEEGLREFKNIILEDHRTKLMVYSDFEKIYYISPKINSVNSLTSNLAQYDYVVLNTTDALPDMTLSNIREYEDRNFQRFEQQQRIVVSLRIKKNQIILQKFLNFDYSVLIQNDNYLILKKPV